MARKTSSRRRFGQIRQLPSGKVNARYADPDGRLTPAGEPVRHSRTFDTTLDAEAWLTDERRSISAGTWTPPAERRRKKLERITFTEYANAWLPNRLTKAGEPLKPATKQLYRKHLDNHILPALGHLTLDEITPTVIRRWHTSLGTVGPTARAHSYALAKVIFATAVRERAGGITENPCTIEGASQTAIRQHEVVIPTPKQLDALAEAMPDRYALIVHLGAWCGLRWGELTELRRGDVSPKRERVTVTRAVTRVGSEDVVGTPKSIAGMRTVTVPTHVRPLLKAHLRSYVQPGKDALLFPAPTSPDRHLSPGGFRKVWKVAATRVGLDGYRIHDLRHHAATTAARAGATTAEVQRRIGHATPAMAARYQHASDDRDQEIAARMSELARKKRGRKN